MRAEGPSCPRPRRCERVPPGSRHGPYGPRGPVEVMTNRGEARSSQPQPPSRPPCLALVGPTASGKTELAISLARARPPIELVSVDSMAMYREMDLGTAKPRADDLGDVRMHLLDVADPSEELSVVGFQSLLGEALAGIAKVGAAALLVGGTGLYMRAAVDGLVPAGRYPRVRASLEEEAARPGGVMALYEKLEVLDPLAASRIERHNARRILRALEVTIGSGRPFSSYGEGLASYPPTAVRMVGIRFVPEVHYAAIERRFEAMMQAGLLDEVKSLASRPGGMSRTARQALGYKELLGHLEGGIPLEAAVQEAIKRTKAFARRQWAWFRRDPRITWLEPSGDLMGDLLAWYDSVALEVA
jgi:tRNA dimethylallyltransferase